MPQMEPTTPVSTSRLQNGIFSMYEQLKFDSARNSLRYLIQRFGIKKLYTPYYLCDVVRHAIVAEKCKPVFYHIDDNFYPTQDFPKNDYILYPNYFGVCDNNVVKLENIYPKLIVDNAHAFYLPPQGFACFNSEKKFRNVESGSDLWIKNDKRKGDFAIKWQNRPNSSIQTRIERFIRIKEEFEKTNLLKINMNSVKSPFCYPYLASTEKEADELAEKLTKNGLVIYRYWNYLPKSYNEYKFYRRLVPIPV